jgi:AhpD family alkylhydroperoxidase
MRIKPREERHTAWYLRPFFWNQRRKYGKALDAALTWAHSPRLFMGVAHLYGALDRSGSPVAPVLRSLVTVRISQINHCPFCVDINSRTLLQRGLAEEKLHTLAEWRTSPLFNEQERVALEYAEAMTITDRGVDAAMFAALREHFSPEAVIELTALIAFQNMSSKFNAALDVPAQGFCRLPPRPERLPPPF